ncbi:hypothetical protein BDZ94DRAFT_1326578 [Collybia nuda]|uniref:Uncharacterized protein n=1 Tax=Collybia nuda TaxID=64659 RepID=A0A9P5XWJ2_9AGAR|nr:hypothetical protein BDZ94DRAFT_1326578 [Collybia nuda]
MSRLTASPFHKPSPFEFPKAPFSPPETNVDMIGPARVPMPGYIAGGQEQRVSDMESSPGALESAGSRFRRVSSIAYHTSGTRESNTRTPQRSPKAFIIVIPPPTFDHEHGQLGHTLSSGPRHRLSQGLLMPLFPTMYGQLTAIAREFNFPSTTGLCLYFHITENGATMTPRISDETWQSIWNHIFETATPAPTQRSPISGKIEFDIDLSQARWYASWVSPSHRDHMEIPFSTNPSAAPSIAHFHRESKSSVEEHVEEQSLTPTRPPVRLNGIAAPTARHIPRKLSLVDRYDVMSIRSGSRRSALSPPEPVQLTSQVLSPIVQEDEPKSARHALDTRVMTWRASAVLKPTPLAATGQISLEPANMPNMLPIDDALTSVPNQELDLGDFTWSISSLGPDEDEPISPISWERLPSIHIAHRMKGSVCMTPSDCTSFGPSDYTLPSPAVSFYRLPSPDIAHRMYEDVPPTPSTVTTWGAPFSYPPSPVSYPRIFSPDLGDKCVFSRPTTPSTATSWGPGSWPSSPVNVDRAQSIHMCDRGEFSQPVTPSTATSWGVPLSYPSTPSTPYFVHTPDAGQRVSEEDILSLPWNYKPWGHSWPYSQATSSERQPARGLQLHLVHVSSDYPHLNIYPSIYPYFDLYPAPAGTMSICYAASDPQIIAPRLPAMIKLPTVYPFFDIYPAVYPRNLEEIYPVITVQSNPTFSALPTPQYPYFDLYPTIHPDKVPCLEVPADAHSHIYAQSHNATQYLDFNMDPTATKVNTEVDNGVLRNSFFDLRIPSKILPSRKQKIVTAVMDVYPSFNLYPAIYPAHNNYPVGYEIKAVHDGCRPGYPHFDLYPTTHNDFTMGSEESSPSHMELISVRLSIYPVFDIYPASYPTFNIYPAVDNMPHGKTASPISDLCKNKFDQLSGTC